MEESRHFSFPRFLRDVAVIAIPVALQNLLSSTGILYREVILTKGWFRDAMGPMITSLREEGTVITVLPSDMGGYE